MSYAIFRLEKINSIKETSAREKHIEREFDNNKQGIKYIHKSVENAATHLKEVEKRIQKETGKKVRKDAVRAFELVLTSDEEFFRKLSKTNSFQAWINKNLKFLYDIFGQNNVLKAVVHFDEKTPHIQAIISTEFEGKFNAKHWVDGRKSLQSLQDMYYTYMQEFGLERGKRAELTGAKHVSHHEFWKKQAQIYTKYEALKQGLVQWLQDEPMLKQNYHLSVKQAEQLVVGIEKFGYEVILKNEADNIVQQTAQQLEKEYDEFTNELEL